MYRLPLLLILCARCLLPSQELRISLSSQGQDLSSLLALCASLAEAEYRCDETVAREYQAADPGLLLLERVRPTSAHQGLAHLLDCWWAYGPDGQVVFNRNPTLPLLDEPQTRIVNSTIENRPDIIELCQRIMLPWSDHPDGSLVFHPPALRWMCRLDRDGFRHFRRLLVCIEHPRVDIPHRLPPPAMPSGLRPLEATTADDWPALYARLHAQGIPLAVDRAALRQPPPEPLSLPACRPATLPIHLQALGLTAAWVDGILCVGLRRIERREHPAQNLQITRLPVGQFGGHLEGQALALRLRRQLGEKPWQRPGHLLEYLPDRRALLVACNPALLIDLLAAIDEMDRGD